MEQKIERPKGEIVWVTSYDERGDIYLLTSKKDSREWYYLYKVEQNKLSKLGKARNPVDLENKYITF